MKPPLKFLVALGVMLPAVAGLIVLGRAMRARRSPAPGWTLREIRHAADDSPMMVVPALEFTMGTADAHPDLPASRLVPGRVKPTEIKFARGWESWALADERPPHPVRLKSYAIDRHEVTNAQYRKFLAAVQERGDAAWAHPAQAASPLSCTAARNFRYWAFVTSWRSMA